MQGNEAGFRLAVIVPVYRQPVLLVDALESALSQEGEPVLILIVVDGCPDPETREVAESYRAAHGDVVRVLFRENGGLSAARNTGIRYLLAACPDLEAIAFLDADNLLAPGSFEIYRGLLDSDPEADWYYPEFDLIGLHRNFSNGGPYSLLRHAYANMCEAGSLVRRRVFEAGVRFDESMRLGYEDWDFWLSAGRKGFRGRPIGPTTLLYRKRPESMLSGSEQNDAEISGYMKRKQAWLYSPRFALALEEMAASGYAVLWADTGRYFYCCDPDRCVEKTYDLVERDLFASLAADASFPAFMLVTTRVAWRRLKEAGLLRFALWDLERRAGGDAIAGTEIVEHSEGRYDYANRDARLSFHVDALMITAVRLGRAVEDTSPDWAERLGAAASAPRSVAEIRLPRTRPARPVVDIPASLRMLGERLRESVYRPSLKTRWAWRSDFLPPRTKSHELARRSVNGGVLFPLAKSSDLVDVGFVTPFFDFGGVERVCAAVACVLRRRGFRTHLFVVSEKSMHLVENASRAFDTVNWFPTKKALSYSDERYFGTELSGWNDTREEADLLGLLAAMDVVINEHSGVAHNIAGGLRRRGVVCMTHEHLVEVNKMGRLAGPPYLAVGFEATYDKILTCSNQLSDWMGGMGVPRSKILALPNGPGYELTPVDVPERDFDFGSRPIRVLFVGRLDWQKGVDRIPHVVRHLADAGVAAQFLLVGKSVVESGNFSEAWPANVRTRPPVYDDVELTKLYRWADVVLLPSRFEGLPLTVPEAQRCGAVVVAADVGAVGEVIENGLTGFLIPEGRFSTDAARTIGLLAGNPALARSISVAAAAGYRKWEDVCEPLIEAISTLVAARRAAQPVELPARGEHLPPDTRGRCAAT